MTKVTKMDLLIHDLKKEEWEKISAEYEGWKIISDNGQIRPCVGCFGCWVNSPGECVIKDGYDKMGMLIHEADELLVMSRYTYGGFSSFVKNVFDRSIGWVLPFFEMINDEMHHKRRYPESKPISVIFRGDSFTSEDKERAVKYVNAVCTNFHGTVKDIVFKECEAETADEAGCKLSEKGSQEMTLLLNCSLRGDKANSKHFLDRLETMINGEKKSLNLSSYIKREDELIREFMSAGKIILGMPLYVDGIPSAPLRIMERIEKIVKISAACGKKIYLLCNMGFYESAQLVNLVSMVKVWCECCGFDYSGCVAIGAGEMLGPMMSAKHIENGPTAQVAGAFGRLSEAVNSAAACDDLYVGPKAFPRGLYMTVANFGMLHNGRKNGLKKKDMV